MGIIISLIISFVGLGVCGVLSIMSALKAKKCEPKCSEASEARKWAIISAAVGFGALILALVIAIFLL